MTDIDTVPCPECGRLFGEHTIVEYRDHTATRVDFQQVESPTLTGLSAEHVIVDHLDIAASVLEVNTELAGVIYLPAVEFRFWSSDGQRPAPIVFVADDDRLWKDLSRLIASACGAAPLRAKQATRQHQRGES
jgi:hypothetical protein